MNIDATIEYMISEARKNPKVEKLILFGSRARGDSHERSDYDFAVRCTGMAHTEWNAWIGEVKDGAPTLCGIDLVQENEVLDLTFKAAIAKEGKVLYDRK